MNPSVARTAAILAICAASVGPPAPAAETRSPETHALLINGGDKPAANYQSHLHHLQEMVDVLASRGLTRDRISIFSGDGEEPTADLAARATAPPEFWLIDGTPAGELLKPRTELTNTRWDGVKLHPARKRDLQAWFEQARERLQPGDELLLFVTDHGEGNKEEPDNGAIFLWHEKLSVRELRAMLHMLGPGVRVVMLMSQCYSATFANAMEDGREPAGESANICGFFSTTRDLRAYGCYPEGRDRDRIGHAFRFIDGLRRHQSMSEAHREVLLSDDTPDVPLRTSDVYLEGLLREEAGRRGIPLSRLVDSLLAQEGRQPAVNWEPQIRLLDSIGNTFGAFSPRRLAELQELEESLPDLSEQANTYAERWEFALNSVREENLASFLKANPGWRRPLDAKALKGASAEVRESLRSSLLAEVQEHAKSQPDVWLRLSNLRELVEQSSQARWRLEVRRAAVLRLRSALIGIAGRALLRGQSEAAADPSKREFYQGLLACEAFAPGQLSPAAPQASPLSIAPFPPLESDLALLERVLPSWLGVRFGKLADSVRRGRGLLPGATILQAVYPDSPASEAGLEAGDIVIGPPGRDFDAPGNLREWSMTSLRDTPVPLRILRPGDNVSNDEMFEAKLVLKPLPLKLPKLAGPPQAGQTAPLVSESLRPVGAAAIPEIKGRSYLLFYWATWCGPCKLAVPEVMAFAEARNLPVLAISDEDADTVGNFLKGRAEPFFAHVAVDPLRKSFIAHGVSGTPTIVLVDKGIVRHRQTGYSAKEGLTVNGWEWSR